MDYDKIKQNIEQTIKKKGLVRQHVLNALDISLQSYTNMFNRKSVNLNTLEKIANYLEVPVTQLIDNTNVITNKDNILERKYYRAIELLAINGIRFDLPTNFNWGVLLA